VLAYWAALAPALEELDVSGVRMRAEDWPVLPQWQLKELRVCAPLELSVNQIRVLEAWSAWETIHLNPSRRPNASCGCSWRLSQRRMQRLRLHQKCPAKADEHGHVDTEYALCSQSTEMSDDGTPDTASPEWQPVEGTQV
jgi:hypothetical protein